LSNLSSDFVLHRFSEAEIIAREKKAAQEVRLSCSVFELPSCFPISHVLCVLLVQAEKQARADARQAKFEADKQAMVQKLLAEQSTQTPSATL
jgi:hypothetical protein